MKINLILSAIVTIVVCGAITLIVAPLPISTWVFGYIGSFIACALYDWREARR